MRGATRWGRTLIHAGSTRRPAKEPRWRSTSDPCSTPHHGGRHLRVPERRAGRGQLPPGAGRGRPPRIPAMARLVHGARTAGVQVIHCVFWRRADGRGSNTNGRIFAMANKVAPAMEPGSEAALPLPEIGLSPDDLISGRYHGADPLQGTDLDSLLRNCGARTVVVAGVSVNVALVGLTLGLLNRGYQVVVPARRGGRHPRRLRRDDARQHLRHHRHGASPPTTCWPPGAEPAPLARSPVSGVGWPDGPPLTSARGRCRRSLRGRPPRHPLPGARPAGPRHPPAAARRRGRAAGDQHLPRPQGRRHRPGGGHVAGDLLPVLLRRRGGRAGPRRGGRGRGRRRRWRSWSSTGSWSGDDGWATVVGAGRRLRARPGSATARCCG